MRMILALGLGLLAAPAFAQPEFTIDQSKLYVTPPETCEALEKGGADAMSDANIAVMTFSGGIQSLEYSCDFFDVKSHPTNRSFLAMGICDALGEVYPDTFAITPYDEKTIQVVSSYDAAMQAAGVFEASDATVTPGATLYYRCDNLSEIPVD
ncbi:hypothetical protein FF80_00191 [Devosia sp. LC5]|uniref:hypothetical protein n=1 Tax=Devosia sp. LC5 TaxID=1502724 RepID=UPI0004E4444E|nr:hypothetical protein [Devosia sp. LC5]KFC72436.1 hypothetical protein FF80_00191 [Devosia sp. LC5]